MYYTPEKKRWKIYLIIGLTRNSKHWNPKFVEALKSQPLVEDVIGLDLPGAGELLRETSPTRVPDFIPIMRQNYEREIAGNSSKLLIAISLGGMVAAEWCRQYPDDFRQTVFINTSFAGISPFYERLRPSAWLRCVAFFFSIRRVVKERRVLELVSNHPEKRQHVLPNWVKAEQEYPITKFNVLRQLLAAWKYTAPDRLPENSLVLCSQNDRLCHYRSSEKIAKRYRLPLVVEPKPTIGHAFHIDGADELVLRIQEHLESTESSISDAD